MSYSDGHLDNLRATVRVSDVCAALGIALKRHGREWKALSPWNKERTPSFTVNDDKQLYCDFSSGRKGDIFELVMEIERVDFPAAVERIEQIGRVPKGKGNGQHQPKTGRPKGPGKAASSKIVATYDYQDSDGNVIYQVVRYEPKSFRQRRKPRPDDQLHLIKDGWVWNLEGVEHTLYRLPDLLADMRELPEDQSRWFVCEGEKDCESLARLGKVGFRATTNSGGAQNFSDDLVRHFTDATDVILLEDADAAGAARVNSLVPKFQEVGARVRVLRIADYEPKGCKDISDWIARGGTDDKLVEITDRLVEWEPPQYKSPYGARTFLALTGAVRSYPWRVKGLIPADDSTLFMGPSRSGKTFAVLDLAMHVALGREKYVGHNIVPGGIAYLSYEGQAGFENRVRAYARYHNLDAEQLQYFAWWTNPPQLFADPKSAAQLAEDIKKCTEKWDRSLAAIIVDTHNSATRGSSEIKSEDIGRVLDCYDVISKATGAPLWIIGHTNTEGRHRGNEQIFNRIEATLFVDRAVDGRGANAVERRDSLGRVIRRMKVEKQREGLDYIQWEFVLDKIGLGYDSDGDEITSMVACEPRDTTIMNESSAPKGAWRLGVYQAKFMQALLGGLTTQGVAPPPDLTYGDGRPVYLGAQDRVVLFSDVSTICRNNEVVDETDEAAKKARDANVRKALIRARDDLIAADVIKAARGGGETKRHYVWPTGRAVAGHGISWPPPRVSEAPPEDEREITF